MAEPKQVNVGTIGHIDHGKVTLTAALVKVLGPEMADKVVILDDESVAKLRDQNRIFDELDFPAQGLGRQRSVNRKALRKARMLDLQRRAFSKELSPNKGIPG
ncbi:GTP-binding protein [Stutzerimonas stutzeri]|uniref:GTP-binding protein n=1 Tax=Stutzerimonas stutzeri TaxID=316 RepID=UPI003C6FB87D